MLLEAMIALFIAAVAVVAACGTIAFTLRYSAAQLKSAGEQIERRNALAGRFLTIDEK